MTVVETNAAFGVVWNQSPRVAKQVKVVWRDPVQTPTLADANKRLSPRRDELIRKAEANAARLIGRDRL